MRHEDLFNSCLLGIERALLTAPSHRGRITRAIRALEDHWIGDLIGAVCLFGTVIVLVIVAGVLS